MDSSLKQAIQAMPTRELIEQSHIHTKQYTDEALAIMKEEIAARRITKEEIEKILVEIDGEDVQAAEVVHYDKSFFSQLDGGFTTNDALLVRAIFDEHKIPFFMDNSATVLPSAGEDLDAHLVKFHVHNDFLESVKSLLTQHFDLIGKRYSMKFSDIKARLKSFNFYEIPHHLLESKEILEVGFSKAEKSVIITYGRRLLGEVDDVEARQERVVFYYDAVEDLVSRLEKDAPLRLTHTDLLTALEVLQIYCGEPDFPDTANGIIEALLGFFLPGQDVPED